MPTKKDHWISLDSSQPKEAEKLIESVDKALTILECFSDGPSTLTLKKLSEKTGLYKSGILRICGTLIARGFLQRLPGSVYILGPKILILGKAYERNNSLITLSRHVVKELTLLTKESASLFVLEGENRLCLVGEESPSPIRYYIEEGAALKLNPVAATGKIFLAHASEEDRRRFLDEKFGETVAPKQNLSEEDVTVILRKGYATCIGDETPEVACISAPVFNHENSLCAALTIHGPTQRFTGEHYLNLINALQAASGKLSSLLGASLHTKENSLKQL